MSVKLFGLIVPHSSAVTLKGNFHDSKLDRDDGVRLRATRFRRR